MSDGCGAGADTGQEHGKREGADEFDDSDCVVADTYDVGGADGMSMASHFSEGQAKRQKTGDAADDARSPAASLSEEQKRVEDMVMAGRNVRHTLRVRADSLCVLHALWLHA
jgi:hypothetical protein